MPRLKFHWRSLFVLPLLLIPAGCLTAQTPAVDLDALEKRGNAEYRAKDCAAAEKTFGEALQAALAAGETHRTGQYYLRFGNCRTRIGDFAASLDAYRHGISIGESADDNQLLETSLHGAALQLQKMGLIDEAIPLAQREYQLALQGGDPGYLGRAMWLVAVQYQLKGRLRDALDWMNRALVVSRTTTDLPLTGTVLQNLATLYLALGDVETAEHTEEQILAMPPEKLVSMSTTFSPAIAYNNLGEMQLQAGHGVQARKSFEKAVLASTRPDDWRVRVDALLNLADMQNKAGQISDADAGFHQALAIAESVQFPAIQCEVWRMRSDQLLFRGDVQGALAAGDDALRVARQLGASDALHKSLLSVGAAEVAAGNQVSAREKLDEALRIAETLRAQYPGEVSDLSRSFGNFVPIYQTSVLNLIDLHLPAEALERAEQAKARVLMDILLRGGVDEHSAMTPGELAEQDGLRKRLAAASAAASGSANAAVARTLQDVTVEFRQFRRGLYANHPELAVQSADFEPAGLDKLAALLKGPTTALLDYFFVPSGVALFVIRSSPNGDVPPTVSSYFLPDAKHTLAAEARKFREQIASRDLSYKEAAKHLFNRLLAPAMADLRGTSDWIVSPDGALWEIPFAALMDTNGRHLIETRAVALEPSLTAALQIRQRIKLAAAGGVQLLALGNPLPSPVPLPDAEREVTDIATRYTRGTALVLTGTSATVAAFRDKAPAARIIHLAAHAGLNDGDPLSSFVNLGSGNRAGVIGKISGDDGVLTALDIMSLHLRADMVVLSACETALGSTGPGEGMIGMGWALSAAGASSSVLSMWKVDTTASREFMTSFYRILSAGATPLSRSEALRQTGLEMTRSRAYKHPFFWAAFSMWGDGSAPEVRPLRDR